MDTGIMPTPCRCYKDINKACKVIRHEKLNRNHLKGKLLLAICCCKDFVFSKCHKENSV